MTETFILQYAPIRVKQLGYKNYHMRYRDLLVEGNDSITLTAFNELFFIVDDPPGLVVESDYGLYDSTGELTVENIHQHRGEIVVCNPGAERRKIKLIQLIIVN